MIFYYGLPLTPIWMSRPAKTALAMLDVVIANRAFLIHVGLLQMHACIFDCNSVRFFRSLACVPPPPHSPSGGRLRGGVRSPIFQYIYFRRICNFRRTLFADTGMNPVRLWHFDTLSPSSGHETSWSPSKLSFLASLFGSTVSIFRSPTLQ